MVHHDASRLLSDVEVRLWNQMWPVFHGHFPSRQNHCHLHKFALPKLDLNVSVKTKTIEIESTLISFMSVQQQRVTNTARTVNPSMQIQRGLPALPLEMPRDNSVLGGNSNKHTKLHQSTGGSSQDRIVGGLSTRCRVGCQRGVRF